MWMAFTSHQSPKMCLVPKKSRMKVVIREPGRSAALKDKEDRKGCRMDTWTCRCTWRSFSNAPRLCGSMTFQPFHRWRQHAGQCLPAPPLLDRKVRMLGGVSPIWGKGVGGVDPHRCPPFKRSSKPSWILKEKPAQGGGLLPAVQHCAAPDTHNPPAGLTSWQPAGSCVSGPPAGSCCCSRWFCCCRHRPWCCWPGWSGCCPAAWGWSVPSAGHCPPGAGTRMQPGPPRHFGSLLAAAWRRCRNAFSVTDGGFRNCVPERVPALLCSLF